MTALFESFEGQARPINIPILTRAATQKQLHDEHYHCRETYSTTMTDANAGFHIRLASSNGDDAEFILAAWDSTLPFLASIGAGEMWGDQPFSQRAGQRQEVIDVINGTTKEIDGGRRFWIAEVYRAGDIVIGFTRVGLPITFLMRIPTQLF